ncbi:glycine--tRNA ligase [Candidatus Falkowbacteria bacterium CG10_big_fil_rev_8_21_14_0_10_37_6]|uniref:Glycine--tRNA ligase n=1 Tax=Candidatus Falkowbacteria bacterium CG10_big_fil_rev_8_21_14_0_10_37_6 TaxID=1974563 RepID=A0A2H0V6H1_9BACT|nr:MAG: glycine--tRNA ligase [Candidatus Falkowbacteria bacterium CG10_big_fil_rev_8_21_14_0_10_37_6]
MEKIVSLCKRRGFIFPGSEIYGGLANSWSYGPYGTELKNNIKKLWWKKFVQDRDDVVGIDGPIILHPKLWEASGHTAGFNDAMVDCKSCQSRFRADHLVEQATGDDLEGKLEAMTTVLRDKKVPCPNCKKSDWTEVRNFNMMFKTNMNGIAEDIYLRPETAGAIFIEFKNIMDSMRVKLPFGVAQIGKAFRNEIVTGNFIFRVREFEQMEIEYFINPKAKWENLFEEWLVLQEEFVAELGADKKNVRRREHAKEKLSHYSKKTVDIEYNFPFGFGELFGLAHRGNFDLTQHSKFSQEKLEYFDQEKNQRFIPHVIEPTFGVERSILVALLSAYHEETVNDGMRVVMKFPKNLAPIQVAIFPLLKNKPELVAKAKVIFDGLKNSFICEFDDNGNVGKRYRRQDEIGTPYCVTVDFDSLEDGMATVRDRDDMKQERVAIVDLKSYFENKFS